MKTEFYYNKRKYTCCIVKTDSFNELRIRNESGEVLAVEQGKKFGLQGKNRESSKEVNVAQPYFYNLIKAARSALEIAEKNQLILEKDSVIERQDEQINILTQQLHLISQQQVLSVEQEQQLNQLQAHLRDVEAIVELQKGRILQLEGEQSQLPQTLPTEKIEKKVITQLSETVWQSLHPASQRDLCNAYKYYHLIKSDDFDGQVTDYSTPGHLLGIVAEREIIFPFFKHLYQFMSTSRNQVNFLIGTSYEVAGITLKSKSRHTLGDLPVLLSTQWETFIDDVLEQQQCLPESKLYRTVFFGSRVSQTDRQLLKQFFQQWQHPLSIWLSQGQVAASTIDCIRQLRNIAGHPVPMYHWQFKAMWKLLLGSKTHPGVLQEIYANSNSGSDRSHKLKEGRAAFGSSPLNSYLDSICC